jgi:hypothetical protein
MAQHASDPEVRRLHKELAELHAGLASAHRASRLEPV